jgi:parallel beta-helix repeat protein
MRHKLAIGKCFAQSRIPGLPVEHAGSADGATDADNRRTRMPVKHPHAGAKLALAVVLAFVVTGVVALRGGEAAGAQPLNCGDTITVDTTLDQGLVDCPDNGIIIGADNITLDLNGNTIDGDGKPFAGCAQGEICDSGVANDGHDGVTVEHGSVRQFDVGVIVGRASHNRLLGISSSGNRFAGLGFFASTRSLMRNSSGSGSTSREDGTGMFLADSHHVRILHNSFRRNGNQGIFAPESTHNLIKGNLLSRNRGGIELQKSSRNQVRRNRSVRDGIGVLVALRDARRNVIARNRIVHPTQARGGDGQGIEVPRGSHNVIARNSIRDASRNAIAVGGEGVRGVGNVVRRNHIRGAGKDGVNVADAKHTLLRRNRASHSRDDGFDIESRSATLTGNRANRNGDLGIEAVRGVNDGGGNVAHHNGDPRQCTNIVCN